MRVLRRTCQAMVLVGCMALVGGSFSGREEVAGWLPRLSPLMAASGRVATRGWVGSFAPALALVVMGLLWDCFFCRWLCPLGTASDLLNRVWAPPVPSAPVRPGSRMPLFLLLALVGISFTSAELAGWFDPLALLARAADGSVVPGRDAVHRLLSLSGQGGFWAREALNHQMQMLALLVLAVALGLTVRGRRAWCRAVCPLGAFYGIVGRVVCGTTHSCREKSRLGG